MYADYADYVEESMNTDTSNRRTLDIPGPSFSTLINPPISR